MPVSFISYSRVSMQRVGMLAAAVSAASDRQSSDVDRAGSRLHAAVNRSTPLPESARADFEVYLGGLRLWKRYGHLKDRALTADVTVEMQDLWLADRELPRATGAITPENASDVVQLAVALRLLRDRNHTRTDRGRALLIALGDRREALETPAATPNPLRSTFSAQLLIAAALLRADGDFLQSVWRTATVLDQPTFTRAELSQTLRADCDDLHARMRRRARTGADRQVLTRVRDWGESVAAPRGSGPDWGGGRPPDQLATLRVEPWVDLGLITADSRFAYRYRVSPAQRDVIRVVASAEDMFQLVARELVSLMHKAQSRPVPNRASDDEAWRAIRAIYAKLRSSLGFAAFTEVVMLAAGLLAEADEPRLLELEQGVELLLARRREAPTDVRVGTNRAGEPTYMKLSEAALNDE